MPGLLISDSANNMETKTVSKKAKAENGAETVDLVTKKKDKKEKKAKLEDSDGAAMTPSPKSEKKSKKRKAEESPEVEEVTEKKAKAENGDSVPKKKKKKAEKSEANGEEQSETVKEPVPEPVPADDPNHLSHFQISKEVAAKLNSKGIEALFPIQAKTFGIVLEGTDLVGRARTGQGKTLAFVLPLLERLRAASSPAELRGQRQYGRKPSVIVLLPTRELAKQVHTDFEFYGQACGLSTLCVYGGAPFPPQTSALRRGVDVVVGTPGRIKDHLEKGALDLKKLKFRVLDEADEMLNMGFVDDVETILGAVDDKEQVQTLLFSATMPDWVREISKRFLKNNRKTVDLVGNEAMKASKSVQHLLLSCHWTQRATVVQDVIRCYSNGEGRTIVFTETKKDATELAVALADSASALHGDIAQAQRETTLAGFRTGKFNVLVATDVAARGLDISDVQIVIQCEPPRDAETYIHRSGRTGRAGNTGISVMLYGRKHEYMIPIIERKAGFKFERISPPAPADIAKASALRALSGVREVDDSVIPMFQEAAETLLAEVGVTPVQALAKALAKIAGHTEIKQRSLLTSHDDATTLYFQAGTAVRTPTYVWNYLRKCMPEESLSDVRRMSLTADGQGAVFDVPATLAKDFVAAATKEQENAPAWQAKVTIEVATSLPALQARPESASSGGYGGGRGQSYGGRGGRGGFGNSRGGSRFRSGGGFRGGGRS